MKKELQIRTVVLRKEGYSVKELHQMMGVSKSTVSRWIQGVPLSEAAKKRIESRSTAGQLAAQIFFQRKAKEENNKAKDFAETVIREAESDPKILLIICSMVYFCEGAKSVNGINFVNSDARMIASFLRMFRSSFPLQERKFRILMQLHSYHDENKQADYWSQVTGIPKSQFNKSYLKPSDHRYKKGGYQGCIAVRYYDASIARKLQAVAKSFMERYN